MTDQAATENAAIEAASPALAALLSPLGRRATFPPDIPFQAAAARGKAFNATIGQVTDGEGRALGLSPVEAALSGLSGEDRNRALLYSPIAGLPELRDRWRGWQRRGVAVEKSSSLPVVTVGLTHGLSLVADLFAGEGRAVAVPAPFWGNYRQTFALRTGARVLSAPAYRHGRYNPKALTEALAEEPEGEPALAILNHPSNPGGYMPTPEERAELVAALVGEADRRPLLVVCDDAYAGLVYEPEVSRDSIFWDLVGVHPSLVPVKIDGGTKELSFFGGRVGFVTFPFAPESAAAEALDSKMMCLSRATVGSPVAASQVVLLQALRDGAIEAEVEALRQRLGDRYRTLRSALAGIDPELLTPLPFNAGCFALLELAGGVDADRVRRHLLDAHDTGLVSIGERYLRIAFCSVRNAALPGLVERLSAGVAELQTARV